MSQNPDDLYSYDDSAVIVDDDAASDDTVVPQRYDVSSYGADYDVHGLVRRLDRGDIFIPDFQRDYVWRIAEASRFIESLLLGLPVPGVFLARESETNRLLVIDGQQRLKSLQFFYNGFFDPKPDDKKHKVFALTRVQAPFEGLTYEMLQQRDRLKLDDSIIHATVIKQESPEDDDTSIYHVFERLNSGGRKLTPQEIRTALYHGSYINLVKQLNDFPIWRQVYGKKNNRLKDQELILRFLALYFDHENYQKPMEEFLNRFISRHKNASDAFLNESENIFKSTVEVIWDSLGAEAFRPQRSLNAAVFDSVMVGLARRINVDPAVDVSALVETYSELFNQADYIGAVFAATSNERSVLTRIEIATQAFANI